MVAQPSFLQVFRAAARMRAEILTLRAVAVAQAPSIEPGTLARIVAAREAMLLVMTQLYGTYLRNGGQPSNARLDKLVASVDRVAQLMNAQVQR